MPSDLMSSARANSGAYCHNIGHRVSFQDGKQGFCIPFLSWSTLFFMARHIGQGVLIDPFLRHISAFGKGEIALVGRLQSGMKLGCGGAKGEQHDSGGGFVEAMDEGGRGMVGEKAGEKGD